MKVFQTIVELQNELFAVRKEGKEIGLVPTMGALHEGHASLVERSVKENGVTVVSVFLNPTQFNDKGDLERYPRTWMLIANCLRVLGLTMCLLHLSAKCILLPTLVILSIPLFLP